MAQEIVRPETADPTQVASLTLAYVGDSVYELIIRTIALERHNGKANELNSFAKKYSNAQAQARLAELIQEKMTEAELAVYKRGRNAKSPSAPHTCTISEYRRATGLEALCAYLYLKGDMARAFELVCIGLEKDESGSMPET